MKSLGTGRGEMRESGFELISSPGQLQSFGLAVSVAQWVSDCSRDPGSAGLFTCACCSVAGALGFSLGLSLLSEAGTRIPVTGAEEGQSACGAAGPPLNGRCSCGRKGMQWWRVSASLMTPGVPIISHCLCILKFRRFCDREMNRRLPSRSLRQGAAAIAP